MMALEVLVEYFKGKLMPVPPSQPMDWIESWLHHVASLHHSCGMDPTKIYQGQVFEALGSRNTKTRMHCRRHIASARDAL